MSTFLGPVEEFPGISVDRFDGENLKSSVYFLSHCHADHMIGLSKEFFSHLEDNRRSMYCTSLSKAFLEGKYELSDSQSSLTVKTIDTCSPIIVDYTNLDGARESVTVLCVSAGHCPGSVMFIFETPKISILYTGDFRISPRDLKKLKPLHYQAGTKMLPKRFDKIYLDTTFLSDNYRDFPSRQRSLGEISRVAKDWISRDSRNVVVLECPANYGSEFVYMELMESLKKRVHVKPWVYQSYSRIPELESCITNGDHSTPLHACMAKGQRGGLKCKPEVSAENILTIVPSAMRWAGRDLSKTISEWDPIVERRFYVCLSMHSSCNELEGFIDYFKATDVHGCVESRQPNTSVQDILKKMTKKFDKNLAVAKTYRFEHLNLNKFKRAKVESKYFSDDSSD